MPLIVLQVVRLLLGLEESGVGPRKVGFVALPQELREPVKHGKLIQK